MKILIVLFAFALVPSAVFASAPMKDFSEVFMGAFSGEIEVEGYEIKKIQSFEFPAEMQAKINEVNEMRTVEWADYVMNSGEFDHIDHKEDLITDPSDQWGSATPLRLDGTFAIYQNGKLIGYVADFSDMVESQVINDGAGWVFYVDDQGNLIKVVDWQA